MPWLVSDVFHTVSVSSPGSDCAPARRVVTTNAASYCTPISRIDDHFSAASDRVTQEITLWSFAEWKSIQRKGSGC